MRSSQITKRTSLSIARSRKLAPLKRQSFAVICPLSKTTHSYRHYNQVVQDGIAGSQLLAAFPGTFQILSLQHLNEAGHSYIFPLLPASVFGGVRKRDFF